MGAGCAHPPQNVWPLLGFDLLLQTRTPRCVGLFLGMGRFGLLKDVAQLGENILLFFGFDHGFGAGIGAPLGTVDGDGSQTRESHLRGDGQEADPDPLDERGVMHTESAKRRVGGPIASGEVERGQALLPQSLQLWGGAHSRRITLDQHLSAQARVKGGLSGCGGFISASQALLDDVLDEACQMIHGQIPVGIITMQQSNRRSIGPIGHDKSPRD